DHVWVEFLSRPLIKFLRPVFQDETNLVGSSPGLDARLIYNKRVELVDCMRNEPTSLDDPKTTAPSAEDLKALQLLLDYIELDFADVTTEVNALMLPDEEYITWNLLWTLCGRGKLMEVARGQEAFEVLRWEYKSKEGGKRHIVEPAQFVVHGRAVHWIDSRFEDRPMSFSVSHFLGARLLKDLPFRPLSERVREKLVADVNRVKRELWSIVPDRTTVAVTTILEQAASVLIAHATPPTNPRTPSVSDSGSFRSENQLIRDSMSEDDPDMCLLPGILAAWDFRTQSWESVSVTDLSPIEFNKAAFDHLVLHENYKQMVVAFVNAHTRKDKDDNALIPDTMKGKGGGMTLTAEAVAEHLERPLYSISCSQLKYNANELEDELNDILERAAGWNCVVLMDEADIFLQARNDNIERSALVSAFLRVLEYHKGVLILTTNRVETFDKAFRSRIDLALKYPDLDQNSRKTLWKKFLVIANAITSENSAVWEEDLDQLSLRPMNGRDIKNAVRSAQTLALEDRATLNMSHINKVLSVVDEF
ncbi:hypothetical protein FRC07_007511, partial [Ceratobasidium sp. 392]